MRPFTELAISILCVAASAVAGTAFAQDVPAALFSPAVAPVVRDRGTVPALRSRFVRADVAMLESTQDVRLNLFDDVELVARDAIVTDHASGLSSWSAEVPDAAWGTALMVIHGDRVSGRVSDGERVFEIVPVSAGVQEVREIDPSALPPEAAPLRMRQRRSDAIAGDGHQETRAVARDAVDAIRVLVVYTPAAAAASADIEADAQLAVDAANDAYANSDMATRIELAGSAATAYVESGNINTDLTRLRGRNDGFMDEVHALRNAYLADFVSLLSNDGAGYCGLAALMSSVAPGFESSAFSVVWLPCAASNWTLAHEVGHNMGCQHDRANAASSPAFAYAFGFQDPGGQFRTVMAAVNGCPGVCPRIAYFANPDVDYLGQPTGVEVASPNAAACAFAIDATSPVTTNFRTLLAPTSPAASTTFSDRVALTFSHPWPWGFQVYRAPTGQPMSPLAVATGSPYADLTAAPGVSYDYWISTLTLLGEESAIIGPVTGIRAVPNCGNGVTESPDEQCDDGGHVAGDGCDPDCQSEAPLDFVEAECVKTINDRAIRVAKAQGKEDLSCVAAAAAGTAPDVNACVLADAKGKVGKARVRLLAADTDVCDFPPPFGYAGAAAAADAGENERRAWLGDLLGADLSAAVLSKLSDPGGAACQKAVGKNADRLIAAYLASFFDCKKERIDAQTATAAGSLEDCFDVVAAQASVEGTRIATALSKIAQARVSSCQGVSLAAAFPGACSAEVDTAFDDCLAVHAACRTCLTFDAADDLSRDCDLFDNGAADSSCAP